MTKDNTAALSQAKAWMVFAERLNEHVSLDRKTANFLAEDPDHFVFYAVDTDVVMCFTSPWNLGLGSSKSSNSPSAKQMPYGVIFPPDQGDAEAASGITFAIAKYVFFHLSDWPLFQLPTHAEETRRVFDAAAYKAIGYNESVRTMQEQLNILTEATKPTEKKIDNMIEQLAKEMDQGGSTLRRQVVNILDQLEPLVIGREKSAAVEMERYLRLLLEGSLVSTDETQQLIDDSEGLSDVLAALEKPQGLFEWIEESGEEIGWMKSLEEEHARYTGKKQGIVQIEADAKALARLSVINKKLEPLGGRMILISGAAAIHRAAKSKDGNFHEKYIRHFHSFVPQAFLEAEKNLNSSADKISGNVRDTFGFRTLTRRPTSGNKSEVLSKSRFSHLLSGDHEPFKKIEDDWVDFRKRIIRSAVTNAISQQFYLVREAANSESGDEHRLKEMLKVLGRKIQEDVWKERLSLAAEFAATGVEFLLTLGVASARNPPDVKFESYVNANRLFQTLRSATNLINLDPPFREQLKKLEGDCVSKEVGLNDLGYVHFIVFAGIFAAANRWGITADLASNAIEIANTNPSTKKGGGISGREAYYLKSSALRLTAKNTKDFEEARKALQQARNALEQDKKRGVHISKLRFDAEEIATEIGEWHFLAVREKLPFIDACNFEKSSDLLDQVLQYQNDDYPLLIQCSVNGIQMASILMQVDQQILENSPLFLERVKKFRQVMIDTLRQEGEGKVRKTYLMKTYGMFADILLNRCSEIKSPVNKNKLHQLFLNPDISTKYDLKRYSALRELCQKLIS
ncbi:MAG: hypothetical protein COW19_03165 [Zetaproteobacteria bacterium CG12_big_fil_rev_8_21_14_0_65_55_1124]|nr:MAG: hypothetical protein AUJ58_09405 [Zetaproteobacteria bacterium CG1_02_55_237]PIS19394.1 MAG: hypothetical protein COT53_06155 [Zetaproteobacteria bacterium CG08_land_8_20_14_0_20_55_17]PIW43438.1 MAG: hypothetical protein COW19_03165 [Zetaproteobacteria bacterium CG12_big_fil_rev_8_21_14_0_65_55_1124]PIY53635.1 MAG: hypothetical protein COZ01_03300 [Zetaproteobacteria bacterium CG_4_10_14_0_8_um_filter_55_43]PIZ37295.1 MAG: hypothetical protein COY36_09885 [Zetaproteobacteria bacterium 